MAEQLQALLTATATLPPSVNPYTFLTSQLHRFAIPVQDDGKPPSYFLPLMKANYAMGACGLLFGLICLGAKAANGGIWFVRKRHTNTGTLYAPSQFGSLYIESHVDLAFLNRHNSDPLPYQLDLLFCCIGVRLLCDPLVRDWCFACPVQSAQLPDLIVLCSSLVLRLLWVLFGYLSYSQYGPKRGE